MRNHGTIDTLKDTASSVVDSVTDAKREALSRGEDVVTNLARLVKKNPIKAVGIAFAVGYVGAKVLRR
jgi:ElaB/YqjD/DUF883 family membrane-anchored ribosome-binding protein